jgi:hypothetical protein
MMTRSAARDNLSSKIKSRAQIDLAALFCGGHVKPVFLLIKLDLQLLEIVLSEERGGGNASSNNGGCSAQAATPISVDSKRSAPAARRTRASAVSKST